MLEAPRLSKIMIVLLAVGLLLFGLSFRSPRAAEFSAEEAVRSAMILLHAPAEQVFPLFGPVREAEWAEGWDPKILSSTSRPLSEGWVFQTRHGGQDAIWILQRYDERGRHIEYVRVVPDSHVARLWIRVSPAGEDQSRVEITYHFTGLTERGNAFVRTFTEAHYQEFIGQWETAINHLLLTGERYAHH